ncbi:hypothetical protein JXO59_01360 [candidate division KSB1 bacterium]|nr:hypothetical protein [candidate division KSB1 bacterium]
MQTNWQKTVSMAYRFLLRRGGLIEGSNRQGARGFCLSIKRQRSIRSIGAVIILSLVGVLYTCSDLERSNPLDPKNPRSWTNRVVLIEAFVNDIGGASMEAALAGLDRLARSYPADQFILLEHHIQKTAGLDSLALPASLTRYQTLAPQPASQAIPDVFFHGPYSHVQGASDPEAAFNRYSQAMDSALQGTAKLTIEASAILSGTQLYIKAGLARLGREDAEDVSVYVVLTSRVYPNRPVVRAFLPVEAPGHLDAGEVRTIDRMIDLSANIAWIEPSCILVVQNSRTLDIYHCVEADLEME